MAGVIKSYGYQNISTLNDEPVMTTVYGRKQPAPAAHTLSPAPDAPLYSPPSFGEDPAQQDSGIPADESMAAEAAENADDAQGEEFSVQKLGEFQPKRPPETVSAEEARIEREQISAEYEAMRAHYEEQSEQYIIRARQKADEIYQKTREMAEKTVEEAHAEAEKIKAAAAEEGKALGYEEGVKQGYDEGYTKALKKCKESLLELKMLSEAVTEQKSEIFMRYERQLFDAVFEIAQKITINSLNQHDKGVITKMLREAGKKYKASKHITIMLSKLDMEENAEVDEDLVRDIFKSSENIEIEVLPDAPRGTLIIDNGSEITDAGVATQLQIIEQLGSGKYRDKSFTELLHDVTASSGASGRKKKAAKNEAPPEDDVTDAKDDDVIPDVAYTDGSAGGARPEDGDDTEE